MNWNLPIFRSSGPGRQDSESRDPQVPGDKVRLTPVDNPIERAEEDAIGRNESARSFAQHILSLDPSEGIVVGVLGPWGSGKTSFVNLARRELERIGIPILDFNPWMFSGAEQLIDAFFAELAAQLRVKAELADVAKAIDEYSETLAGLTWLPIIGSWIDRGRKISQALSKTLARSRKGIGHRRARLEQSLTQVTKPIVVILDDIDRLSSSEIREIFKLVRLTANFPNIIYVMAFDRARIEEALGEQGVPGRAYLEKILQVAVDLPKLPPEAVQRQLLRAIDSVVSEVSVPGPFDESAWPDILMEVIRPLVRNMRDVRRYSTAIRGTLLALNGQVALADVLGVEAVRVFLPDVFVRFHDTVDGLTTVSDGFYSRRSTMASLKASIEALVSAGKEDGEVVKSMIRRVFPAAQQHIENYHFGLDFVRAWLRERRIAHADILRLYLERVAGEGLLAFTDAERGIDLMSDQAEFDQFMRSLSEDRLQDVIASFENFEDHFEAKNVQGGVIVLLNLLANLPERKGGMFTVRPELAVARVVLRMLRSLPDATSIQSTVAAVLPQLLSLHAKQLLVNMVGHREGVGHKLVPEAAAADFAKAWRADLRSASPDDLERESDLLFLLFSARRESVSGEPQLTIPAIPKLTLAILRSATSEIASQTLGNRAVRRSPRIEWDALIEVFDGEDNLKVRIQELKAAVPDADPQLMTLVDQYCDGWRPKPFEI